ncbi:NTP transferase domain-containing protein [Thioclava atlantica]|uniref:Xanthine dehydrogenase accessory factor n=1 Tax=Thioclava atlantica TaxID=1317124 RepID=A0A085U0M3_9RHOB|nr:xanthine dehydrogenase accessory factor [Thioclava atlantica]
MRTLGILLSAGTSRRFGAQDKLLANWNGAPLVLTAARALEASGCDTLIAIVSSERVATALPPSFQVHKVGPNLPLSHTWHTARDCATWLQAERALFVLGDMPFVSTDTLRALVNRDGGSYACASNGIPMPPALLTADDLKRAPDRGRDQGARELIRALPRKSLIPLSAEEAIDIDTPADLHRHRDRRRLRP